MPLWALLPLKILKIIFYDHIITKTNIIKAELIITYSLLLYSLSL